MFRKLWRSLFGAGEPIRWGMGDVVGLRSGGLLRLSYCEDQVRYVESAMVIDRYKGRVELAICYEDCEYAGWFEGDQLMRVMEGGESRRVLEELRG